MDELYGGLSMGMALGMLIAGIIAYPNSEDIPLIFVIILFVTCMIGLKFSVDFFKKGGS